MLVKTNAMKDMMRYGRSADILTIVRSQIKTWGKQHKAPSTELKIFFI